MNLLEDLKKCRSFLHATYYATVCKIESIHFNKKDANGSLWLLILSNQTQSVYSSSTLVDSSLRC